VGSADKNLIPDAALSKSGIDLIVDEVTSIDKEAKTVATASGEAIGYEKLFLATGSMPLVPPLPGMEEVLAEQGIKVMTNNKATAILGNGKVKGVKLDSGEELKADVVIFGIGVRPSVKLAQDAGLKIGERRTSGWTATCAPATITSLPWGIVQGRLTLLPTSPPLCGWPPPPRLRRASREPTSGS
jgi:NAD(P)H-nitrite reductase large subunit